MRGLRLLILLGLSATAWSATVYRWVDDNGVVHFSDQPNPRAQKLEISGAQTYGSQAAAPKPGPAAGPPTSGAASGIPPVCVIDTPQAGAVFLDTFSVTGHVTLANVGEGSQSMLRLDGVDISPMLDGGGGFALNQIDRGEHTLTLQVTNSHGDVVCQANSVAFAIRQRAAGAAGNQATAPTAPAAPQAPMAPGVRR
jgi:hypothetical protein